MQSERCVVKRADIYSKQFTQQPSASYQDEPHFIDVGGSGFRAVAVWMINHLMESSLHHSTLLKIFWIHTIFERHIRYFPTHYDLLDVLLSPSKPNQSLSYRSQRELLDALSYTLGRIAFDELCDNPVLCRGIFSHEQTARLRDLLHGFLSLPNQYGVGALASALHLSIDIWQVNTSSDLHARYQYGVQQKILNLRTVSGPILQLQGNDYFLPRVNDKRWITILSHPIHVALKPVSDQLKYGFTLAELHTKLVVAEQHLLEEFIRVKDRLVRMVQTGELTLHHVQQIYKKTFDVENKLVHYVGTERGSQHYFEELFRSHGMPLTESNVFHGYEDGMMNQLLIAIARAMSLGDLSIDLIDSYL